ncbi:unnamed protein product [Allacma fusca]|uniref:Uncharacterized protein n=1 Tax=Allacma fusca TaxID=39272 RepID=A0A8J2J667_9HEXA|nr:unnamed protein product [Allacma fusca]
MNVDLSTLGTRKTIVEIPGSFCHKLPLFPEGLTFNCAMISRIVLVFSLGVLASGRFVGDKNVNGTVEEQLIPDGKQTFFYAYNISNGISVNQTGYVKEINLKSMTPVHGMKGCYSYTSPEGAFISVSYIAEENGFEPNPRITYPGEAKHEEHLKTPCAKADTYKSTVEIASGGISSSDSQIRYFIKTDTTGSELDGGNTDSTNIPDLESTTSSTAPRSSDSTAKTSHVATTAGNTPTAAPIGNGVSGYAPNSASNGVGGTAPNSASNGVGGTTPNSSSSGVGGTTTNSRGNGFDVTAPNSNINGVGVTEPNSYSNGVGGTAPNSNSKGLDTPAIKSDANGFDSTTANSNGIGSSSIDSNPNSPNSDDTSTVSSNNVYEGNRIKGTDIDTRTSLIKDITDGTATATLESDINPETISNKNPSKPIRSPDAPQCLYSNSARNPTAGYGPDSPLTVPPTTVPVLESPTTIPPTTTPVLDSTTTTTTTTTHCSGSSTTTTITTNQGSGSSTTTTTTTTTKGSFSSTTTTTTTTNGQDSSNATPAPAAKAWDTAEAPPLTVDGSHNAEAAVSNASEELNTGETTTPTLVINTNNNVISQAANYGRVDVPLSEPPTIKEDLTSGLTCAALELSPKKFDFQMIDGTWISVGNISTVDGSPPYVTVNSHEPQNSYSVLLDW